MSHEAAKMTEVELSDKFNQYMMGLSKSEHESKLMNSVSKKDFKIITTAINHVTMVHADSLLSHLIKAWAVNVAGIEGYTHVVAYDDGIYGATFDIIPDIIDGGLVLVGILNQDGD